MISSDVLLGSQDILDDSSWGPQKRFFGFSLGGYLEGGVWKRRDGFMDLWSERRTDSVSYRDAGLRKNWEL